MRILIAAATTMEVAPVVAQLSAASGRTARISSYVHRSHAIDVLVTGVGMVASSAWTSRTLLERTYDLAIGVGVCGSFDGALAPGSVVNVVTDRIAELGAEDGDAFIPIESLLPDEPLAGFKNACVHARLPENAALAALPAVNGITVNTVHGRDQSIAEVVARFHPHVESMEGAGFMFASAIDGLRFAQVRAVSNMVERRNRSAWKIAEAIAALAPAVLQIIETV